MDEQIPITYSDLIYSANNYIHDTSPTLSKNLRAAATTVSANAETGTITSNSGNIASTTLPYTLSWWEPLTSKYSNYNTSIDYGDIDYTAGVTWRLNDNKLYHTYDLYGRCDYTYGLYNCYTDVPAIIQKRSKIKNNLITIIKSRAQDLRNIPDNEWVAMQTLREMITETAYRKYLKDGFITVQGQSGKIYQIFRNKCHTKVYLKGELVEEICVRLKGNAPPTDSVIAFKTMIEVDEESFAALGNRYNMRQAA